jgi:hypothetical protein
MQDQGFMQKKGQEKERFRWDTSATKYFYWTARQLCVTFPGSAIRRTTTGHQLKCMVKISSLLLATLLLCGCTVTRVRNYSVTHYTLPPESSPEAERVQVEPPEQVAAQGAPAVPVVTKQEESSSPPPAPPEPQRVVLDLSKHIPDLRPELNEQKDVLGKLMLQIGSFKDMFFDMTLSNRVESRALFEQMSIQVKAVRDLAAQNIKFWEVGSSATKSASQPKPDVYTWLLPVTIMVGYVGCMVVMIVLMRKLFSKLASLKSAMPGR